MSDVNVREIAKASREEVRNAVREVERLKAQITENGEYLITDPSFAEMFVKQPQSGNLLAEIDDEH